jgi:hypothetical protein
MPILQAIAGQRRRESAAVLDQLSSGTDSEDCMEEDGSLIVNGIRVNADVLRKNAVQSCADGACMAACCSGGVWLRDDEAPRIRLWAGAVKECLPARRHDESKWFCVGSSKENHPFDDEVGTTTFDDPLRPGKTCCVFLQPDRKCALQVVSQLNNLGWPGLKPYYCSIYPLYIEDGVLSMDDEIHLGFDAAACGNTAVDARAMYDVYQAEAILILGESGYRELRAKAAAKE